MLILSEYLYKINKELKIKNLETQCKTQTNNTNYIRVLASFLHTRNMLQESVIVCNT